ncbi:MAG: DUF3800 domain-containing protein [Nitrospirota bacterium]
MLMLKAFFDDSGKSNDPAETVYGIGGCVAPLAAWELLEKEWKTVLDKFCVPYLHMKEYAHSTGAFQVGWKGEETKRRDFLSSLMDIMVPYVMTYLGATVLIEDFNRLTDSQKKVLLDPHFMCMQDVFLGASIQAHDDPPEEKVDLIFSQQDEDKGHALALYSAYTTARETGPDLLRERLGAFTYASFKDTIPLQVADLVAYELRSFAADLFINSPTLTRVPLKRLFRQRHFFNFFTHDEIVKRFYFSGHRGPF